MECGREYKRQKKMEEIKLEHDPFLPFKLAVKNC